jgi:hypothetical protein
MAKFDQNVWLIGELSEEVQSKLFEYCSAKRWKISGHNVDTAEPGFEEIKKVFLDKAKMVERRKLFIGSHAMELGYAGSGNLMTSALSKTVSTVLTTARRLVSHSFPVASNNLCPLLILKGVPKW